MGSVLAAEPARDWVALLDADASLASAIAPATLAAALPACVAPVFGLDPGPWQPPRDLVGPGGLGLLVLEGFLVRQVDVVGRPATELLGAGDLLRPWQPGPAAPVSAGARGQVLEPCRVALLDERVCAVIGRWPDLVAALVGRALTALRRRGLVARTARRRLRRPPARPAGRSALRPRAAARGARLSIVAVSLCPQLRHTAIRRRRAARFA